MRNSAVLATPTLDCNDVQSTAQIAAQALARISHRAVRRARGKVMSSEYCGDFGRLLPSGVHADPIAALAALKPASLALPSTHSHRYGFQSRAARAKLDSTHRSRSL